MKIYQWRQITLKDFNCKSVLNLGGSFFEVQSDPVLESSLFVGLHLTLSQPARAVHKSLKCTCSVHKA